MLRTLLESQSVHARRAGGTLVSVGVHTTVIALAIVATARATSAPPHAVAPAPTNVIYLAPQPKCLCVRQGTGQTFTTSALRPLPPVSIPSFSVAPPSIDAIGEAIGQPAPDWGKPYTIVSSGGPPRPTDGVYKSPQVDKAAVARPGNPAPLYPPSLRAAQIEGSVVARFVVDTTGLAEPESITFPEATHAQFAEAVRQSLLRSRYLPALVGGQRVRQLVEQHFAFTLTR